MRFSKAQHQRQAGMTLVELMVATGISSILLLALLMLSVFTARSFAAITNYMELDKDSRTALDQLTRGRNARFHAPARGLFKARNLAP